MFHLIVLEALENDEIAARLNSTRRAVKFHVANILQRFGVAKREQLILLFWRERLDEERRALRSRARLRKTQRRRSSRS